VTASDISREALRIAAANSERHGVRRRIDFFCGDLLDAVKGPFDCIVSNPPYIDAGTYARLDPGVRDFEPAAALLAGPEGIECHRALAVQAKARLRPGGWLVMEAGEGQGDRIRGLLEACGAYEDIFFRKDYGGRDRVVAARRS
jgi:release factor glutamine methyltransferase